MSAILNLIDSQIKVVEELYEIAQGTFWNPYDPCYNRNVIRLLSSPIHKGKSLQILSAAFEMVLSERKAYAEKFEGMKENGRKTQAIVCYIYFTMLYLLHALILLTPRTDSKRREDVSDCVRRYVRNSGRTS